MTTHRHYALAYSISAALCAVGGLTVAVRALSTDGLGDRAAVMLLVSALYTAAVLTWAAARELAAGRRAAAEQERTARALAGDSIDALVPCCALYEASSVVHSAGCTRLPEHTGQGTRHIDGPAHGGLLCFSEHGDVLCVRPAGDGHSLHIPYRQCPSTQEERS